MKAIILVGGKATRLLPLTETTPKALIPVLNIPFLEWVIRNLAGQQIQEIILALGHMARQIERIFGDGRNLGVKIRYSVEESPLGSGGAAKLAERYLDDTFLVFNGDNFIDIDIRSMVKIHRDSGAKVTVALTRVDDPTSYGLVETQADGRVARFLEKPKLEEVTTDTVNAGAWLVEPEVMSLIPSGVQYSFERNVFPELLSTKEKMYSYTTDGYWMDAGTPEKYLQLHRDLLNGRSRQYVSGKEIIIGENTTIDPSAELTGKIVTGPGCSIYSGVKINGPAVIGAGCSIQSRCIIDDAVIWNDIKAGPEAAIKTSIIGDGCLLERGCISEGSVVADRAVLKEGVRLIPGSRIRPGTIVSRNL